MPEHAPSPLCWSAAVSCLDGDHHPQADDDHKGVHDLLLALTAKELHVAREVLGQNIILESEDICAVALLLLSC